MRQVLDVDARSAAEKACSACESAGITTWSSRFEPSIGGASISSARAGGAQDVVGGDPAPLARQFVAAARPADALEDAVAHQRLQHRLEMPWRQPVARRQRLSGNRPPARMERDVDDGGNGQNAFAGQKRHEKVWVREPAATKVPSGTILLLT